MQDTLQQKQDIFSQDSFLLIKKGDFPFVENTAEPTVPKDTSVRDLKKKFIESQIKTKLAEPVKKIKKLFDDGLFVRDQKTHTDTSLLSIKLVDTTSGFRFKDIVAHTPKLKQAAPPKKEVSLTQFFTSHELKPAHSDPVALNRDNSLWVFFALFIIVMAFAWIRVFYTRTIRQIFQALMSMTVSTQLIRDENLLLQRASVMLTVLFNMVVAFFLYQASVIFEWSSDNIGTGFGRFLLFAILISFIYTFKFIILKIIGFVFKTDKPLSGYIFNIFLINNVLGMLLLPVVVALPFLPASLSRIMIFVSLGLIALGFFYRLLRGLFIGISYSEFSKFYLLLYLCTLEIAPLLVLIKLFVS